MAGVEKKVAVHVGFKFLRALCHMLGTKLILMFVLFCNVKVLFAQTKGALFWESEICTAEEERLPYATFRLKSENQTYVAASDKYGQIRLKKTFVLEFDSLIISSIGFKDKRLKITEQSLKNRIYLDKKIYNLDAVEIRPKESKLSVIGNGRKTAILSAQAGYNSMQGLFISSNGRKGKLEKVRIYMHNGGEKKWKNRPFRLHLYSAAVDVTNQLQVFDELIEEELVVALASRFGNWLEINIAEYDIILPERGLLIAVEALTYEEYKALGIIDKKLVKNNILNTFSIGYTLKTKGNKNIQPWDYINEKSGWTQKYNRGKYYYLIQAVISESDSVQ